METAPLVHCLSTDFLEDSGSALLSLERKTMRKESLRLIDSARMRVMCIHCRDRTSFGPGSQRQGWGS